jgi:membrane protein DedA with SNARE-associated domain
MALGGLTGMLINDLVLFGISRIGRDVVVNWIGAHSLLHWHLSAEAVMGAKFLPPLRSAAYLIYGLQGVPLTRFLEVSLLSSTVWIIIYALLGHNFKHGIGWFMEKLEVRGRWTTAAEIALTVGVIALVWL